MGFGIIHGGAGKQKLNTKISTESELVGMSEYLPYNIWLVMFLEAHGYKIVNNTIYQDNKSAILMGKMDVTRALEILDTLTSYIYL